MAQTVRDVMTADPVTLPSDARVSDAARTMRERDIGVVIVTAHGGRLRGVVTDRDIVVRAVGERRDPWNTLLDEICSKQDVATVTPDVPIETAIAQLREKAVRRLPVVEHGRVLGVVSAGDLAAASEPPSLLADLSRAPSNR